MASLKSFFFLLLLTIPYMSHAFLFEFNIDDKVNYRTFSASIQNVEQNQGIPKASFEQAYEAFLRTQKVISKKELALKGEYHYSQRLFKSNEAFSAINQDKIYQSTFTRKPNGKITVLSSKDFYPSVRSVPVFPSKSVEVGESWVDMGYEAQDFSLLGYKSPFLIPFKAQYQYIKDIQLNSQQEKNLIQKYSHYQFEVENQVSLLREGLGELRKSESEGGTEFAIIKVIYKVDYRAQDNITQTREILQSHASPVGKAVGYYQGLVFWDKQKQEEAFTIGEYDFTYLWENGEQRRWSGKEYGVITRLLKDDQKIQQIASQAKKIDKNMQVTKQERGVKLILGDILFEFNKAQLKPAVKQTLYKVVQILKENTGAAIHISGHSDNIGSKDAKEAIAQGRAKSVASFLLKNGIDSTRISFNGMGDIKPLVPNTSEHNRKKNRRVEMDIITQ